MHIVKILILVYNVILIQSFVLVNSIIDENRIKIARLFPNYLMLLKIMPLFHHQISTKSNTVVYVQLDDIIKYLKKKKTQLDNLPTAFVQTLHIKNASIQVAITTTP